MIVCVIVGENGEYMFNNRRPATDAVVRSNMIRHARGSNLYIRKEISPDFLKSFGEIPDDLEAIDACGTSLHIVSDPLQDAQDDDFAYCDTEELFDNVEKIQCLIVFNLHHTYPAEVSLTNAFLDHFEPIYATDYVGQITSRVTETIYSPKINESEFQE